MKCLFPPMEDRPEKWMPAALIAYWIFAFAIIPVWLPLFTDGLWGNQGVNSWIDVFYHTLNAVVMTIMLKTYAWESFLNVQIAPGKFVKTVGVAVLLMLALLLGQYALLGEHLWELYPLQEMTIAAAPGRMIYELPVIGILCHTVLIPISVTGLFYAPGFAPMCCRKTWLGYLILPLILLAPVVFEILWRGVSAYVIPRYLFQLPMHLIACWAYQKADTVWASAATLALFNLGASIIFLLTQ